jgi:hypothetical protein
MNVVRKFEIHGQILHIYIIIIFMYILDDKLFWNKTKLLYNCKFAKDHLFDIAYFSPITIILKSYFP